MLFLIEYGCSKSPDIKEIIEADSLPEAEDMAKYFSYENFDGYDNDDIISVEDYINKSGEFNDEEYWVDYYWAKIKDCWWVASEYDPTNEMHRDVYEETFRKE